MTARLIIRTYNNEGNRVATYEVGYPNTLAKMRHIINDSVDKGLVATVYDTVRERTYHPRMVKSVPPPIDYEKDLSVTAITHFD